MKTGYPKVICTPMFATALFTKANIWKQPKHLSVDEWVKRMWYIYTGECYSVTGKEDSIPFVTTWMDFEYIKSKISQ